MLQQSPLPPIIVGKSVNNGNFSVLMKNVCISPQFKRFCFFFVRDLGMNVRTFEIFIHPSVS